MVDLSQTLARISKGGINKHGSTLHYRYTRKKEKAFHVLHGILQKRNTFATITSGVICLERGFLLPKNSRRLSS